MRVNAQFSAEAMTDNVLAAYHAAIAVRGSDVVKE
jgi:hypothetical protein